MNRFFILSWLCIACLYSYVQSKSVFNRHRRFVDEGGGSSDKQGRLRILPDERKTRVEAHQTLVLTCLGENQEPGYFTDFQWFNKDGEKIESKGKYNLNSGEGSLYLIIQDPDISDSGHYRCTAQLQKTRNLESTIEIDVYKGITWDDCPPEQDLIEGLDHQKVVCKISSLPMPKINWEKDGKPLDRNLYAPTSDGVLIKGPVSKSNAGSFKVAASMLQYGILRTRIIRIQIIVSPKIIAFDPVREIVDGERAEITCLASGSPPPFFSFLDNNLRNLSITSGFTVDKIKGILKIDQVKKEPNDQYISCEVENKAGRESKQMKLKVLIKPQIYQFDNATFIDDLRAVWTCRARGNPPPKLELVKMDHSPRQDRIGEKNLRGPGSRYTFDEVSLSPEEKEIRMIIDTVQRKDDGLYLCKANNSAGAVSSVGHIQVQYVPDLSETNLFMKTWLNRPINLSCIGPAIPNATFSWRYNNQDIRINDNIYTIIQEPGISHLEIKPNQGRIVYGNYECTASNPLGERRVTINLKEAFAPTSPNVRVIKRKPTSLHFEISDYIDEANIKNYHVRYWQEFEVETDARKVTWPVAGKNYILSNLSPQTRYRLTFAAENAVGIGLWSTMQREETPHETRPEKANFFLDERQERERSLEGHIRSEYGDRFDVLWRQAEDNGREIEYYLLKLYKVRKTQFEYIVDAEENDPIRIKGSQSLQHTFAGLQPNTFYKIELVAVNLVGKSDPSELIFKTSDRGKIIASI